jgi:hypothetical protein
MTIGLAQTKLDSDLPAVKQLIARTDTGAVVLSGATRRDSQRGR